MLFAGGGEVADAALATVAEAGKGHRPTLLVLDYADDAPPAVLEAAAALAREPEGRALMICVLHHDEQGPPAFAALLESGAAQRLRLDPLGEDATAEIAALYAPAEGVAMPLRTLLAESDGVPLRIHRAAGEWARAEAAERLAATAGRAMSERPGLRTTEAEIAGSVVDLQTARERKAFYEAEEPADPSAPEVCPFRGLAPFDAAHAEYFFGRERLVAELVARLVGSTLLAVVGPSGSGKSSAVRAGLLPALADGVVPGSERWRRALMRPGERPLAELSRTLARAVPEAGGEDAAPWIADALDRLEPGERLVLLIDQFEEAFVACRDPDEREAFLDALVEGAGRPRPAPGRRARDPRRLLRALRRARRALDPGQRQPGPGRADAPRRAAAGDRAARAQGGTAGRAAAGLGAGRRRRRQSPAACRCSRPRCSSSGSGATAAPLPTEPTSAPAASRGPSRAWPRTPTSA